MAAYIRGSCSAVRLSSPLRACRATSSESNLKPKTVPSQWPLRSCWSCASRQLTTSLPTISCIQTKIATGRYLDRILTRWLNSRNFRTGLAPFLGRDERGMHLGEDSLSILYATLLRRNLFVLLPNYLVARSGDPGTVSGRIPYGVMVLHTPRRLSSPSHPEISRRTDVRLM